MEHQQQSNSQLPPLTNTDSDFDHNNEALPSGVSISKFDYSVENHFKVTDKIAVISGESEFDCEDNEIQRLCSSVTFLRKWRDFCYQPRAIRFACEDENSQKKSVTTQFNLPQFSSATVPKDTTNGNGISSPLSKDFVMNVGGHVWALDWCPRVHQSSDPDINVEFIAVSAHPPESSYHRVGAPLTGRGLVQIWYILNTGVKDQDVPSSVKVKPKKYPKNNQTTKNNDDQPKRPRGRPRKNPVAESVSNMDCNDESTQNLAGQSSEKSNDLRKPNETTTKVKDNQPKKPRGRPRKNPVNESVSNMDLEKSNELLQLVVREETDKSFESCKPEKPRRQRKNTGNNQFMQTENSNELLQMDGNEETDISFESCNPQKSKGRTRKKPTKIAIPECCDTSPRTSPQPLAFALPEHSNEMLDVDKITLLPPETVDGIDNQQLLTLSARLSSHFLAHSNKSCEQESLNVYTRKRKCDDDDEYSPKSTMTSSNSKLRKCQTRKKGQVNGVDCESSLQQDPVLSEYSEKSTWTSPKSKLTKCQTRKKSQGNSVQRDPVVSEPVHDRVFVSEDVALPRLVMGLAHNGKVAWDVKWKPFDSRVISKHVIGYLAVLLGNGALEVWEVPLPSATKAIYSSSPNEGTDPRFVKLKPIFRSSMLKCGDRQSIPLTMEWSTMAPHDLILAGCHDGVVAVWKFSDDNPDKDTRPLLCFNGDTVPIRALKWAPAASDPSGNIIVTGGHKGVKFWDIRDPFNPLWDVPSQKIIYGLDWLPDPKCVVLSSDDGEIKIISLSKAASDVPVTGIRIIKTPQQQQGLHSYNCSSSSIWSIQVSLTGMVAYCCSDGKVVHFQLTIKAVEKDPSRNRAPHYLCGSLNADESSTLTVVSSSLPDVPLLMKKSLNKVSDTPGSKRGFVSSSNQEKRANEKTSNSKKQPKGSKKNDTPPKGETSQELVCVDNNDNNTEEENDKQNVDNKDVKEELPPKIVAMHRVRWNMNKGSEKLLCYGGAAGILRCQKIS